MRIVLITLLIISLTLIVIGYLRSNQLNKCPPPRVEYRYIPRTFEEEQMDPTSVTEIHSKMFFEKSPWLGHSSGKLGPTNQREANLNQFFVSQTYV